MSVIGITALFSIASLIAVSDGQCIRIRSGNTCQQPSCSLASGTTSLEDLTTLLAIVRALEERETPKPAINNAEEIILQLVNALVYATTHNVGCPKASGNANTSGSTNTGAGTNNGGTTNTGTVTCPAANNDQSDALITLELLQGDSPSSQELGNLITLGLANKNLLEVGVGNNDGLINRLLNVVD